MTEPTSGVTQRNLVTWEHLLVAQGHLLTMQECLLVAWEHLVAQGHLLATLEHLVSSVVSLVTAHAKRKQSKLPVKNMRYADLMYTSYHLPHVDQIHRVLPYSNYRCKRQLIVTMTWVCDSNSNSGIRRELTRSMRQVIHTRIK